MRAVSVFTVLLLAISFYFCSCEAALPGGEQLDALRNFLPAQYRNANISLDDVRNVYREKCKSVIGAHNETLYAEIESGVKELGGCLAALANFTTLEAEIEKATPEGNLDMVFVKYCDRVPKLEECVGHFGKTVQPCLSEEETKQYKLVEKLASSLLNFLCTNGGSRIALFVAEGGRECLREKAGPIVQCLNASVSAYIPKSADLQQLVAASAAASKPCDELERFQNCTVQNLEKCKETTPANLIDSIFNYIKKETHCRKVDDAPHKDEQSQGGIAGFFKGIFS